jgi:acyl dehydratase
VTTVVATIAFDDVHVGTEIPQRSFRLTREDLVRYAGASGDFNPIHWSERAAREVGLPDVLAHGMLTMATAGRLVTDWVGDPGAVVEYGVRFAAPVPVPDDGLGAEIVVSGVVAKKLDERRAVVNLTARCNGAKVLTAARATVRLA